LGLLPDVEPRPDWTLEKYVMELQKVPVQVKKMDLPDVQAGTGEIAMKDLSQVVDEEDHLAQEIGSARRRLSKIEQLSSSVGEYRTNLTAQEDRLLGVGWLTEKVQDSHTCPVCTAVHTQGNLRLNELQQLAQEFSSLTASLQRTPIKLDQELANLRQELRDKESLQKAAVGGKDGSLRFPAPARPPNLSLCRTGRASVGKRPSQPQRRRPPAESRNPGAQDRCAQT
jgi:hypothetical protein